MSKNLSVRFCATTRALLLLPKGPVRRYRVRGGSKRQPFSVLLCRHTPQTSGDNRPSSVADRAYRLFTRFPIREILGNPASGIYHSRKVRGLREHRKSRGSNLPGSLISAPLCVPPVTYVQDSHRAQGHLQSDASAQPQVPSQDFAQQ